MTTIHCTKCGKEIEAGQQRHPTDGGAAHETCWDIRAKRMEVPVYVTDSPDSPDRPEYVARFDDDLGGSAAINREICERLGGVIRTPDPSNEPVAVATVTRESVPVAKGDIGLAGAPRPGEDWRRCANGQSHWVRESLEKVELLTGDSRTELAVE